MIKERLKQIIGMDNVYYIRSLFPSEFEKQAFEKRKNFFSRFIQHGDLCFDVGANLGNRIEPFLDLGAKVVAFEPQEMCYKYLTKKFGSKITLIKKGAGSSSENKTLHISSSHTISSFSDEWISKMKESRFKNENWNEHHVVEMTTLDEVIEQHGIPDFIKIDVEGYELEVLKGLSKSSKMISFEYALPEQTQRAIDCINQILHINSNYVFNYSVGESLKWDLTDWITGKELSDLLLSGKLVDKKDAGDIYAKLT